MSKNILKVMTCGNIDDGKSTLLGRLLFETENIFDDQIQSHVDQLILCKSDAECDSNANVLVQSCPCNWQCNKRSRSIFLI